MQQEQHFPFLRLPRELRDEIYKYFVAIPLPPVPDPIRRLPNEYALPPYMTPRLDVAILRVNKQIHDEASRILYSQNVFRIQFRVSDRNTLGKIIGRYRDNGYVWYWDAKVIQEKDLEKYRVPAPRYRHLIRHIRVDFADHRVSFRDKLQPAFGMNDVARLKVRKLLMPFLFRIKDFIGDEYDLRRRDNVRLDINIIADYCDEAERRHLKYEDMKPTFDQMGIEIDHLDIEGIHNAEAGEFRFGDPKYQVELIESVWPLTQGPWKYTIKLPAVLERLYGKLTEPILQKCTEATYIDGKELKRYKNVSISQACEWTVRNGHLKPREIDDDDGEICSLGLFD
ncbi:hypothetical protein H072_538 [Dactylellina haptotyla CBS 200.50]|uniref:F-box domain-containing protein n=1 Tax=Dactylellina haptotyla (strain CBS 200.50) TaxID=1284197 RepID=S8AWY5_DACHA|nr:hypothetical protein H072_538 [Dactylellina haptotyla CBS 200.50]